MEQIQALTNIHWSHFMYTNHKWVIFSTAETGSLDVTQVIALHKFPGYREITSSGQEFNTDVSGSYTYVKYEGSMPSSVSNLTTKSEEYTQSEILSIFSSSSDWWSEDSIFNDNE